jgi:hypothetical protein
VKGDIPLVSLGEHAIKGYARPSQVFMVARDGPFTGNSFGEQRLLWRRARSERRKADLEPALHLATP